MHRCYLCDGQLKLTKWIVSQRKDYHYTCFYFLCVVNNCPIPDLDFKGVIN